MNVLILPDFTTYSNKHRRATKTEAASASWASDKGKRSNSSSHHDARTANHLNCAPCRIRMSTVQRIHRIYNNTDAGSQLYLAVFAGFISVPSKIHAEVVPVVSNNADANIPFLSARSFCPTDRQTLPMTNTRSLASLLGSCHLRIISPIQTRLGSFHVQ